jgi:hypothetical protein
MDSRLVHEARRENNKKRQSRVDGKLKERAQCEKLKRNECKIVEPGRYWEIQDSQKLYSPTWEWAEAEPFRTRTIFSNLESAAPGSLRAAATRSLIAIPKPRCS